MTDQSNCVSFEQALQLQNAGFRGDAEHAYRVHTLTVPNPRETRLVEGKSFVEAGPDTKEIPDPKVQPKFGPTTTMRLQLSNRFTDSWNDMLVPAYSLLELTQFDPELRVRYDDDLSRIVQALLPPEADADSRNP